MKFISLVTMHLKSMGRVDSARAENDTAGFLKLIHKKDGTFSMQAAADIRVAQGTGFVWRWLVLGLAKVQ